MQTANTEEQATTAISEPDIQMSAEVDKLMPALLKARAAIPPVPKRGHNQHFDYDFAKFEDFISHAEKALADNELIVMGSVLSQSITQEQYTSRKGERLGRRVAIIHYANRIVHGSGQWIQAACPGEGHDTGDKALYKAITGARKYGLQCLLNLSSTDDPENSSPLDKEGGNGSKPAPRKPATPKPSAPAKSRTTTKTPADDKLSGVFTVTEVKEVASGTNKHGNPWTKYAIETAEDTSFGTFHTTHAEVATNAHETDQQVHIGYTTDPKYGHTVETIEIVSGDQHADDQFTPGCTVTKCEQLVLGAGTKQKIVWMIEAEDGGEQPLSFGTDSPAMAAKAEAALADGKPRGLYWRQEPGKAARRLCGIEEVPNG